MLDKIKRNKSLAVIWVGVFIAMLIYYIAAHPLYIYDVDDWAYVNSVREALPSLQQWNPTKILPETMMPFISFLSAYIIYPVNCDYIEALSIGYAVFISIIISTYAGMVGVLLKKIYNISGWLLLAVLFFYHTLYGIPWANKWKLSCFIWWQCDVSF